MSNLRVLGVNLSTYTLSADGGSAAGFPLSNLQTYYSDEYWKSGDATSPQYLLIDLGTATECNMLVLANHNMSTVFNDYATTLSAADDAAFTTGVVSITADLKNVTDPGYISFSPVTKRYWQIYWDASAPLSEAPYIGNLFLGQSLEFTSSYEHNYKKDNAAYETYESMALDGRIRTSQVFSGRYIWELAFKLQDDTLATGFRTFMSTIRGKQRPFYLIDSDGTIRYMHLTEDYVPITTVRYGRNDVSLKMREQMATR